MSLELHWVLYVGAIGLIVIGIAGVVTLQNIFRIVLALVIAEAGANLLLVIAGYRFDAIAPILNAEVLSSAAGTSMVDPVPQAMVLTAIVIGVGIQALAVALVVRIYQHYGTLNLHEIHRRMLIEINQANGVRALLSDEEPDNQSPLPESETVMLRGEK